MLVMATFGACSASLGFDNPVFYRPMKIQGTPVEQNAKDWQTSLGVNVAYGSTHKSRDGHEKKRQLLSIYGPVDLVTLGLNLNAPAAATQTNTYWGKTGLTGEFGSMALTRQGQDGMMDIAGCFRIQEVDVSLQQTLIAGFFLQADLPVRDVSIDQVKYNRLGNQIVSRIDVDAFIKNQLPQVLKENGFTVPLVNGAPVLPTSFKKIRTPEAMISLGWQGVGTNVLDYFDAIRGKLQLGGILPMGSRKDEDLILAIPIGYNNFFGVSMDVQGELKLWKYLVLGGQAGAKLFLRSDRTIRLRTLPVQQLQNGIQVKQQGWFALGRGKVSCDPGTIWNFAGYIKGEHLYRGLSITAGYTFARQEETWLSVKDDTFLSAYVNAQQQFGITNTTIQQTPLSGTQFNFDGKFVSKNEIVNDDQRFKMWDMQTIHLMAEYDMKHDFKATLAPCFGFSYDLPITGRRVLLPEMFSGSASFSCTWDF